MKLLIFNYNNYMNSLKLYCSYWCLRNGLVFTETKLSKSKLLNLDIGGTKLGAGATGY